MPIAFECVGDIAKLGPYQEAMKSLIKDYQLERHLPQDFNLTVEIRKEGAGKHGLVAPLQMDLSTRKVVLYANNFSDAVAPQEEARQRSVAQQRVAQKTPANKKEDKKQAAALKLQLEKLLAPARAQVLRRALEPGFREAVLGPLLWCTLTPVERRVVMQSLVPALSADSFYQNVHGSYWPDAHWARKEFHAAVGRCLPVPGQGGTALSTAPPVAGRRNLVDAEFEFRLDQLAGVCAAHWFTLPGAGFEQLPHAHADVNKAVRMRLQKKLQNKLRSGAYADVESGLLRSLLDKDVPWVEAQTVDGAYDGLIVFHEDGWIGQERSTLDIDDLQLVLHKEDAFSDVDIPPVLSPMTWSMSYANGKVHYKPVTRASEALEFALKKPLLQVKDGGLPETSFDASSFDPLAGVLTHNALHWLQKTPHAFTCHPWAQTPEPARSQLLARPEISEEERQLILQLLVHGHNATLVPSPSMGDIVARLAQRQEAGVRQTIEMAERQDRGQLEQALAHAHGLRVGTHNAQALARLEIERAQSDAWCGLAQEEPRSRLNLQEQSARLGVQGAEAHGRSQALVGHERNVRHAVEREQARDVLQSLELSRRGAVEGEQARDGFSLRLSAVNMAQGVQRQAIQQQEQEQLHVLGRSAEQSQAQQVRIARNRQGQEALEDGQQRARGDIESAQRSDFLDIREMAQTRQAQHTQRQALALEKLHKQLNAQAAALERQQQVCALKESESQARCDTWMQQQEERSNLHMEQSQARMQMAVSASELSHATNLIQQESALQLQAAELNETQARLPMQNAQQEEFRTVCAAEFAARRHMGHVPEDQGQVVLNNERRQAWQQHDSEREPARFLEAWAQNLCQREQDVRSRHLDLNDGLRHMQRWARNLRQYEQELGVRQWYVEGSERNLRQNQQALAQEQQALRQEQQALQNWCEQVYPEIALNYQAVQVLSPEQLQRAWGREPAQGKGVAGSESVREAPRSEAIQSFPMAEHLVASAAPAQPATVGAAQSSARSVHRPYEHAHSVEFFDANSANSSRIPEANVSDARVPRSVLAVARRQRSVSSPNVCCGTSTAHAVSFPNSLLERSRANSLQR